MYVAVTSVSEILKVTLDPFTVPVTDADAKHAEPVSVIVPVIASPCCWRVSVRSPWPGTAGLVRFQVPVQVPVSPAPAAWLAEAPGVALGAPCVEALPADGAVDFVVVEGEALDGPPHAARTRSRTKQRSIERGRLLAEPMGADTPNLLPE